MLTHRACLGLLCALVSCGASSPAWAQDGVIQRIDPGASLPLTGLAEVREDPLLAPGRRPVILAVRDGADALHPEREPLLVLHGIKADFGDVAPMIERLVGQGRFQVHVLAYADVRRRTSQNGQDLAELLVQRFAGRRLTLVAHSLGGIVARAALNELAADGRLAQFPRVRLVGVDVPWHGYKGPPDGLRMALVRPFMPDGYEDMRARSPMFQYLYARELPANVAVLLVVARSGDQALDYRELPGVPAELARRLREEPPDPKLDIQVRHAADAIWQSEVGRRLRRERPQTTDEVTTDQVTAALERGLLRLPGDHSSVLAGDDFLRALEYFLR